MAEKNKAIVTMSLTDGTVIDSWVSLAIRDSFTDPLGSADFEFRPQRAKVKEYADKIQKGVLVGVAVNGIPQGKYLIQSVRRRVDREGVTFSVHAESVLATPYQASVNPFIAKAYPSDAPVTTVVLEALAPFGFQEIVGDTAASRQAISGKPIGGAKAARVVDTLKHKDCQAQDNETAYQFCSRIFNRLGVALRVNHEGTLLLSEPDYDQDVSYSLVQDMDGAMPGDRMLDGFEFEDTNDGQFSECVVRGLAGDGGHQTQSGEPIARIGVDGIATTGKELFSKVPKKTEKFGGHAYQSVQAAPYKPKIVRDNLARDIKRATSAAKLIMGVAASKAFSLTCEVSGLLSSTGRVWTVDTIARVFVEVLGFDEDMWIAERTLVIDRNGGQRTRMKLLPKGALVLGDVPS